MSNTIKAVLGIAAIVFAPMLAPALLGGMGIAATAVTVGAMSIAVTMLGASLVGSSAGGSMSSAVDQSGVEGYAGAKLQTSKSNISPVPILYGEHKIGGNIIFQTTNATINGNNTTNGFNRDYWAVMVICDHLLNNHLKCFIGEDELPGRLHD